MGKTTTAFTLAEVLIVLVIIGIIASMTIPALMQNIQDQQYKAAYKKAFSVANQAFLKGSLDNSYVSRSSITDIYANYKNWYVFKSNFKIIKNCNNHDNSQCWNWSGETSNGAPNSEDCDAFIDSSGMAWSMRGSSVDTDATSSIFLVDTNGFKGPNKYGKDRFGLVMASNLPFEDLNRLIGVPTKISFYKGDWLGPDDMVCPSGGCYYKSWLSQ